MGENGDSVSLMEGDLPTKGLQPRVVLGLLSVASLAGVWVSPVAHSVWSRIVTWLVAVTIGIIVGGLYWRVVLFDPDVFEDVGNRRYVRNRWQRLESVTVRGFVLSGVAYLLLGGDGGPSGIGGVALGTGLVLAPVLHVGIERCDDDVFRRTAALRSGLLLVVLVSLGGFAWLETGTDLLDWAVRLGHVGAFSLWVGGAIWHNFVVVPTIRARPDAANAVRSQARTFRRHLPVVVVLLALTGIYQTDRITGLSVPTLLSSRIGHLVALKLFVLTVLTGLVIVNYRRTA